VGLLVADLPAVEPGEEPAEEAPLPEPRADAEGDAGIPVVVIRRVLAEPLLAGSHSAEMRVELIVTEESTHNVVGRIPAGDGGKLPDIIVVGAHYDHLGMGGPKSLAPDAHEVHNGADDNASGTAALVEIARLLAQRREELRRDVYLVAFSAEESGVLGSTQFVRTPPEGASTDKMLAMINMDMVGRLRDNRLTILGGESAGEWEEIVAPLCDRLRIDCVIGGEGYGPSDVTPFYAAGVPVLYFFNGPHDDYHKPSDDADKINAAGGAQIAALVADVTAELSRREERLTYQAVPPPAPQGDVRSYGASLGTVPDYAGPPDGRLGVLLSGVRAGSPAEAAGMQRDDILVELAGHEIRDIYDFVYVLRQAKPGEKAIAVVERKGKRIELEVVFGTQSRPR
jgi:hypothetical protein